MTETATKQHNAKAILTEALDTIKATYWIAGKEFELAGVGLWDTLDKAIDVDIDTEVSAFNPSFFDVNTNKAKVTGVCSIGAIAIANVTLYDEPLASWDYISQRDLETFKAGAALAMTILEAYPFRFSGSSDPGEVIASWNDSEETDRETVIDTFTKALASPILDTALPYTLEAEDSYSGTGKCYGRLWFADKQAALAFIASTGPLRESFDSEYNPSYVWAPVPIEHEALASA